MQRAAAINDGDKTFADVYIDRKAPLLSQLI
jgi:hypothetical protein